MATDALNSASDILAAGRKIYSSRLRTISENIANADSTVSAADGDPYRRKIAVFQPIETDKGAGPVGRVLRDTSDFRSRYEPNNPIADPAGYIKLSNVNVTAEFVDLQMTIRAYESNLNASLLIDRVSQATIDLLK